MGAAHRALSSGNCCKVDPEVPLLHALCSGCALSVCASAQPGFLLPFPAADPALMALAAYSRAEKPLDYPVPSLPSLKALQPQRKPIHLLLYW